MSAVKASIDIDAPPAKVWDLVMDPNRLAEWVTIHRKLGASAEPPLEVGDELEQTLHVRGVNFNVHWTVREADPPWRAVWEGRGPARSRSRTVYEVQANGDGTRFEYHNEFTAPGGPLGSAASRVVMGSGPQREARKSLQRLKKLLEAR
jgi:uncharacterized protein YndB with AHSA1/START domain